MILFPSGYEIANQIWIYFRPTFQNTAFMPRIAYCLKSR